MRRLFKNLRRWLSVRVSSVPTAKSVFGRVVVFVPGLGVCDLDAKDANTLATELLVATSNLNR
jgi:hypothetical protein